VPNPEQFRSDVANLVGTQFTTTHWSIVLAAGEEQSPGATDALAQLCRTYWYPLYAYIRRRGHEPHDAQDLTQEFFAQLLERPVHRLRQRYRDSLREQIAQTVSTPAEVDEEIQQLFAAFGS
jgi:hypothetical protein